MGKDKREKRKDTLSWSSWRKIKNNGNSAKKRRELIKKILSPDLNVTKILPTPQNQFIENTEIAIPEENEPTLPEPASERESECENEGVCEWESELSEDFVNLNDSQVIEDRNILFKQSLSYWSGKHLIRREALNDLLELLNETVPELNLPKDSRTVMKTSKTKTVVTNDNYGGSYWHYGLEKALNICLTNIGQCPEISLNVNIDGLPLFKSSKIEFWPILFNIHGKPHIAPMVIGIYCGKGWYSHILIHIDI